MSENGFSLVETLLAMFLLSLVSITALVMLYGFFSGYTAIGTASSHLSKMMSAREQLIDDLLHTVIRPSGEAEMPVIFYGDIRDN
ncbi:MAG: prepilin-type N-terminal cleavage/methylation domain-containing protein, partial [Pseudomonadota bacterium]|nr:prepilin-type N-terminal cleavage/methylation domain-containing protein [Pseudomonadota bacterium]